MAKKLHTHSKLRKGYGWKRHPYPCRVPFHKPLLVADLPSSVDLRPEMPVVYDQKNLGSCTSQALAGLGEYLFKKLGKPAFTPSRLFIYYNERVIEGTVSDDAGASLTDGATVLSTMGCPRESIWWYNTTKFRVKPNKKVYADGQKHLATHMVRVDQNLSDMQSVLANGTPIVGGFTVYDSFESDDVSTTGIVPMPRWSEGILGGHAVLIVGYDNKKKWFIVRNSWGSDWGDAGYCYMPYKYWLDPGLADDFWTGISIE